MRLKRRALGAAAGMWLALLPVIALAQEESRTLARSPDWAPVMLFTFAGVIGLMLVATLGYLYRTRRNIVWDFQEPDEPHGDAHH